MKGITSRSVQGMLLGWLITFEGFFALSIAGVATIDGIGGIRASTFTMAAAQLTILGAFITIMCALRLAFPALEKPLLIKLFNIFTYLAMALVAVEGLVMVFMAGNVMITGFGGVGKRWIALTGAQLFAVAALSLRYWRLRNVPPTNFLVDTLGSVAAALLMMEGLTAMGIAGNATIVGFGTILERTVLLAGLQLLVLGLAVFAVWTLTYDPLVGSKISKLLNERRSMVLMTLLGGVVCLEAIVASTVAGTVTVQGASGAFKIYVVAGIAQLFALGLVAPMLWKIRSAPLDRHFIPTFLSLVTTAILAFEGVFAMALAANTFIDGTGTILERTFRLAGAQLLIFSALALIIWLIKDSPLIGKLTSKVLSSVSLLTFSIIALEGIAVIMMAVNIRIDDFSGVGERYVLLGGLQMTLLAALALFSWIRFGNVHARIKTIGTAVAVFFILMLPFALLV